MCAVFILYSQSELQRRQSELKDEALDEELQRIEEELMEAEGEGDDSLLESKTDDDLMLAIEEFM